MMKKRMMAAMLAGAMVLSMTACGNSGDAGNAAGTGGDAAAETPAAEAPAADAGEAAEAPAAAEGPVELVVTTTFAGEDSNAQNYKDAVKGWEAETGNSVVDTSATADETFKTRVATDFETGSEPDVVINQIE